MSQVRTNAILDASGGTTATVNGIPLRPGVLDPENRIINGAFDFWQRGTSFTGGVYTADRWVANQSGGTVTTSRQAFTLGDTLGSNSPTYFLRQTVSGQSTSSHAGIIVQRIEGVRSYAGQTITILGWARRSSGSGNMAISLDQDFGTGGSPSAYASGTGQTVTLTGSFAPFALTFAVPSISGKTLGTNGNDLLAVNVWTSAGSTFNARTNSLGLQTIGVDLWGIHIKQGTHTTSAVDLYRQPELGPELARCQRYYQEYWSSSYSYPLGPSGYVFSATNTAVGHALTVALRAGPAISIRGTLNVRGARVDGVNIDNTVASINTIGFGGVGATLTYTMTATTANLVIGTMACLANGQTGQGNALIYDAEL
jgi:hypothetical protein